MESETFENSGNLGTGFALELITQMFVLETSDVEFAAGDGLEESLVLVVEKVESSVGMIVVKHGSGDLVEKSDARAAVVYSGNKLQIATVCRGKGHSQRSEAVYALFHVSPFHDASSVTLFYLAVVFEKGDIVGGGFDAQDKAEFVVHLDRDRPHIVLDAGSFDSDVEIVPHLVLVIAVELAAKECSDVVRLDSVDCRASESAVYVLQCALPEEHDIGSVLGLHQAPVILEPKMSNDGTEVAGEPVQKLVNRSPVQLVGKMLSFMPVVNGGKGVVQQREFDPFVVHLGGQPAVAIEIDLQSKGAPGGYPDIAKSQIFINEIEVVVETSALVWFQIGALGLLVVPRLVRRARFHGRQDGDQTRLIATFFKNLLDQPFFPGFVVADTFNLDVVFGCQLLCVLFKLITERFSKTRIVEDPDLVGVEVSRHTIGVTKSGQGSLDDYSIEAAEHARNLWSVSCCNQAHGSLPEEGFAKNTSIGSHSILFYAFAVRAEGALNLFGSGLSGLG